MPNSSSSKGKGVDKSTPWSDWVWDSRRQCFYSSRYDPRGNVEYSYKSPDTSQQNQNLQETPRTPGENIVLSTSNTPTFLSSASSGGYTTQESPYFGVAGRASSSVGTPSYQNQPTTNYATSEAYTTNASVDSQTPDVSYSSQLARYPSSSSNTSSFTSYGSSVAPKSEYISGSKGYTTSELNSTFRGLSLTNQSSTIIEQDYIDSSNVGNSQPPQTPSNYIGRTPNSPDKERLDPRYRCVSDKEQRKFWKIGRVFMMLWTEPTGGLGSTRNGTHYSTTWLHEGAYSEIRRFVVLREGYGNSVCSPIHTYNGQATLKPNLPERQQHTIIYTSKECPDEHSYILDDGTVVKENLSKDPIRVRREQNGPEGDLGAFSRLNYVKIYTVENTVRVLNIGMVEHNWIPTLMANSIVRPADTPVGKPEKWPTNESNRSSKGKVKDGRRSRR